MVDVWVSWSSRAILKSLAFYFPSQPDHAGLGYPHNRCTGCKERMQELSQLAASKEPLFPFSTQVDDSADHATLTVTVTATTQFKERVKLTERQKKGADKNIT